MTRVNAVHVPDALWGEFESGLIDHFEYGSVCSVAVYVDGRRVEFDSVVTEEMVEAERVRYFEEARKRGSLIYRYQCHVDRSIGKYNGTITGWTA